MFSEAFVGLGLGAAVAVSVCLTGEGALTRDSDPQNNEKLNRARGAVLCRAAPSFLRFGSFELPARRGEVEVVRRLATFCLNHLGPHLEGLGNDGTRRTTVVRDVLPTAKRREPHCKEGAVREARLVEKGTTASRDDYLDLLVSIVRVRTVNAAMAGVVEDISTRTSCLRTVT